ncbi:arginase [Methylobacter sp. YRD-M1]|uniref:arginase n=1 Tax=Methylobacter sp. YRD-M1 TaxID=2911520 RepID=UPI00227AB8AF|nr:arginase [Methylobacter sp. YRD-M1]WAK03125.1 arginase [Methylobacter sp. YRD-M1]
MTILQTLGIASCLGGPMRLCGYAAELLRDDLARQPLRNGGLQLQWHIVHPDSRGTKDDRLRRLNRQASEFTRYWTEIHRPFLVVGGDHSCAMGTWPGVLKALPENEELGLIWIDAHMDAHTFETSPSGNIHGMPVSALLGKADARLSALYPADRFIKPENLIQIGVRSYEQEEYDLLQEAGVRIIFADQIASLEQTLQGAMDQLSRTCLMIGISIDLDFIDPIDAPGVETPASGGLRAAEFMAALRSVNHDKICGLEISEYNPENDQDNKTLALIKAIIEAFYADNSPNKSLGSSSSGINGISVPK